MRPDDPHSSIGLDAHDVSIVLIEPQ